MSNPSEIPSARTEKALLIVFADLTRYMVNARGTPDATLAELLDGYYHHAEGAVEAAGGRMVKFMGDAFLAVWPEERAGAGVAALPGLKRDIDAWWTTKGWDSRVVVKAHFGRAVAGPFGAEGRFDVIGNEVNVAATLPPGRYRCRWKRSAASRTESGHRSRGTRRQWSTSRWTIRALELAVDHRPLGATDQAPRRTIAAGGSGDRIVSLIEHVDIMPFGAEHLDAAAALLAARHRDDRA